MLADVQREVGCVGGKDPGSTSQEIGQGFAHGYHPAERTGGDSTGAGMRFFEGAGIEIRPNRAGCGHCHLLPTKYWTKFHRFIEIASPRLSHEARLTPGKRVS